MCSPKIWIWNQHTQKNILAMFFNSDPSFWTFAMICPLVFDKISGLIIFLSPFLLHFPSGVCLCDLGRSTQVWLEFLKKYGRGPCWQIHRNSRILKCPQQCHTYQSYMNTIKLLFKTLLGGVIRVSKMQCRVSRGLKDVKDKINARP